MSTLLINNNQPTKELKIGWVISLGFSLILLFYRDFDTLSGLVLVSLLISMLAFKVVNYQISSFASLFILTSIIFYPLAVSLNLFLPFPAVRPDLWVHTYSSLIGYIYSVLFFIFGLLFVNLIFLNQKNYNSATVTTSLILNLSLFSLIFIVVILRFATGNYFHVSISGVSEVSNWSNILAVLSWVAYCGFYLQMDRYFHTKKKIDGIFVLLMAFVPVLLYLPSGNRESAIEHLPIALILYLTLEKNLKLRLLLTFTSLLLVFFLLAFMYAYRGSGLAASSSVAEQYSQVAQAELVTENQSPISQLAQRVSEFAALGRVIEHVPSKFPYSGLQSMDTWWQIFIPGTFRPDKNKINFNEPAEFSLKVGVAPGWWSSAPLMITGDLFRRFGWIGLCFGMFVIGASLRLLDYSFREKPNLFRIIFYVMMAKTIWRLYASSLLGFVTGFTRDLIVAFIISWILTSMMRSQPLKNASLRIQHNN